MLILKVIQVRFTGKFCFILVGVEFDGFSPMGSHPGRSRFFFFRNDYTPTGEKDSSYFLKDSAVQPTALSPNLIGWGNLP